jgi:site-specific DNA-methyltransferase (adenine-specific)/modification methylase
MIELDRIYNEDCLEGMKRIPDGSVDAVICDLPYGVLNKQSEGGSWDSIIPLEPLWEQYKRIIKDNGAIVLFAQGMFTAQLMMSNPKMWRYNLVWDKMRVTGFLNANRMPMRCHEDICVFYRQQPTYNPIMKPREGVGKACYNYNHYCGDSNHLKLDKVKKQYDPDWVQPSNVLEFNVVPNRNGKLHPTQKPTELLEYLIKTFTNKGDVVLDNCMGSGSTGVAAVNTGRNFIGIELDDKYFEIAENRINEANDPAHYVIKNWGKL